MDTNTTHETQFVFRRLAEMLRLGGKDIDSTWWLALLIPVLLLGLVYVAWMYRRESRTIGMWWALFLGLLRTAVYGLLAWAFLLPAWQTWDVSETRSKLLVLFDVSGSMGSKDDMPSDALPVSKMLTRQDKIIRFLTDGQVAFLKKLQERNPITAYRAGGTLDEDFRVFADGKEWSTEEWNAWLKPDPKKEIPADLEDEAKAKLRKKQDVEVLLVSSTNLPDAILAALNRESNNKLQGIIVVSDGRNTQFSTETLETLKRRTLGPKGAVMTPIFTIGVGEHRQPVNIRITDIQHPESARPDDKFPIRVGVDGDGLAGQPVDVSLDVTKPNGEKVTLRPNLAAGEMPIFKPGEPPHIDVEFEIDKPEVEGEWQFVARVPKDKREVFEEKEHVKEPVTVQVVKKPIRVLLFAGAPTHDYQFVRNLFVREVDKKRAELSIYIQLARPEIVQDVPAECMLSRFPLSFRGVDDPQDTPETRYDNLAQYDVIMAFDPDWTQLSPEQMRALELWVSNHAGGLILVAGPVNTFQLARGVNYEAVKPLLDLFPVFLDDSRLQSVGVERSTTEPWRLNFPGATNEMEFLKLDEESKDPLGGWEEFFTGQKAGEGGPNAPLRRGFYSYYPTKGAKPNATVVATFSDPRARAGDKEQPFLVTMPYGSGKVIYIASGEMWRLRQCREIFHERFWTKLARYVSSGSLTGNRHGNIYMGNQFTTRDPIGMQAHLFDRDLQPLAPTAKPEVTIKPPAGVTIRTKKFNLEPKRGQGNEVTGWFEGRFQLLAAGNYEIQVQVPGSPDVLTKKFEVVPSDPEKDNTQPDFTQLRLLASDWSGTVSERVANADLRDNIKRELERTNRAAEGQSPGEEKPTLRLFFDLKAAGMIPECMKTDHTTNRNRGPIKDIWDDGFYLDVGEQPQKVSLLLLVAIGLLSLEWLTRKLLRLA